MTSRELTSDFDFWSRGRLCMAVMHIPMKFGAYIFIYETSFVVRTSYKNFVMIRYLVFKLYKDLNFFSFRLESPIHAPKILVFWGFYPQSLGVHRSDP